jgi:hypothetical protein
MTKPSPSLGVETPDEIVRPRGPRADAEPPAAARWRAAEDRLYPLIIVDPSVYEAAVTLVCEVADVLRAQCGSVAALSAADPVVILARCPSAPVMSALGFDPRTAFDAACAYRWRELTTQKCPADKDGSR